jgi:hypothetical protein
MAYLAAQLRFADSRIALHPLYTEILATARSPAAILDFGCCMVKGGYLNSTTVDFL